MYSTAKGAGKILDRASWIEISRNHTEVEEDASGKGLLDGDGCGLLLGLIVECQYALDGTARRHESSTSISALLACCGAIVESVSSTEVHKNTITHRTLCICKVT
jgi:hypothetical protein